MTFQFSLPDGEFERRHVLVVDLVDLCPPLEQDPHHLLPPAAHGVVQRRRVPEVVTWNLENIPALALHWLPGEALLVDVLAHVESDHHLLHVPRHRRVIQAKTHFGRLFSNPGISVSVNRVPQFQH